MTEEPLQVYRDQTGRTFSRSCRTFFFIVHSFLSYYSRPTRLKELIREVNKKRVLEKKKKKRKATTTPAG